MFQTYDEPESPNEGSCLRNMCQQKDKAHTHTQTHTHTHTHTPTPGAAGMLSGAEPRDPNYPRTEPRFSRTARQIHTPSSSGFCWTGKMFFPMHWRDSGSKRRASPPPGTRVMLLPLYFEYKRGIVLVGSLKSFGCFCDGLIRLPPL